MSSVSISNSRPNQPVASGKPIEPLRPSVTVEGQIVWSAHEGQVVNAGVYVLCLLTLWLLLPAVYALYRFFSTWAHHYLLTDQRLRETRGLLFKVAEHLELYRVKDVSVEQPLVQRLLGRGRVILRTSDLSTPTVVLSAVASPYAVADLRRDSIERCRVAKGVREVD